VNEDLDIASMAGEIVATCQVMMSTGLVAGTWGNVSRRCRPGGILITPSGVGYESLRSDDLVPVDLQDGSCGGRLKPSTETQLHLAIYLARPDVAAIVHTHSPYAAVFAVNRMELPPVLEEMAQLVGGGVRVAPYAAPGTRKLAEGAVATLQGSAAVLLANHGLVGVGRSLREALTVCQVVERSAQVFLWARLSGTPYLLGKQEIQELRQGFVQKYGQSPGERG
jgi:L-fuculose-phosphate aldolase